MNTFQIYEEFKGFLGEPAAKSLAHTLGTMFEELRNAVTKEDFRILRDSMDANVARLDTALGRLAEAQERTEGKVGELAAGQERLTLAQARTESKVSELAEAQTKLAVVQADVAVALQRLTIRTDAVVGRTFELQFRDRLTAYLGRFLRRGRLIANDELLDAIEKVVDDRDADDLLRADAIAEGIVDGSRAYVVVEASSTGDADDIVWAERRAATLRKAGLTAIPLVACDAISPESLALARMRSVRIWCNGSMIDSAA